jgi:hypothetical protein
MRFSLQYYVGSIPDATLAVDITLAPLVVSAVLVVEGGPTVVGENMVISPFDLEPEIITPFALSPVDMTPLDMEN